MLTPHITPADNELLDLMLARSSASVDELAQQLEVTRTAVRQRLGRLEAAGCVTREAVRNGRGRPRYCYSVTLKGRRRGGANLGDFAVAAWKEIRQIEDSKLRRTLFKRIARRLVASYAASVEGATVEERMESLATIFGERRIPCLVHQEGELPVFSTLTCPYPGLADDDRDICRVEREMFSQLLGKDVRLSECRLDGDPHCTFAPVALGQQEPSPEAPPHESRG